MKLIGAYAEGLHSASAAGVAGWLREATWARNFMPALAHHLGVRTVSLYRHADDKNDLINAVGERQQHRSSTSPGRSSTVKGAPRRRGNLGSPNSPKGEHFMLGTTSTHRPRTQYTDAGPFGS